MFCLYEALVRRVLTYSSDFWGFNMSCVDTLDKLLFNHVRRILHVKATTCNDFVFGESGLFPPSVYCHINVCCYYHRLRVMQDNRVVRSVFKASHNLNDKGFNDWVTRLCELASYYKIYYNAAESLSPEQFKLDCRQIFKTDFINRWMSGIYGQNTLMMTYASYKTNFVTENYLDLILVVKHRVALTKIKTSSHNFEIERGRYVRPRLKPGQGRCVLCSVKDDEIHLVTQCRINAYERRILYQKISSADPEFTSLNDREKLI